MNSLLAGLLPVIVGLSGCAGSESKSNGSPQCRIAPTGVNVQVRLPLAEDATRDATLSIVKGLSVDVSDGSYTEELSGGDIEGVLELTDSGWRPYFETSFRGVETRSGTYRATVNSNGKETASALGLETDRTKCEQTSSTKSVELAEAQIVDDTSKLPARIPVEGGHVLNAGTDGTWTLDGEKVNDLLIEDGGRWTGKDRIACERDGDESDCGEDSSWKHVGDVIVREAKATRIGVYRKK